MTIESTSIQSFIMGPGRIHQFRTRHAETFRKYDWKTDEYLGFIK